MKKIFVVSIIFFAFLRAYAGDEILIVPAPEAGAFSNSDPTKALLWDQDSSKAVVVFIPGGDGFIKLNQAVPSSKVRGITKVVAMLTDPSVTSGTLSAAFLPSPYSLGTAHYPPARFSEEHIKRVVSVLKEIKEKTKKPIWLYGHSNGTISTFEVFNYLQAKAEDDLLAGLIVSGSRNVIRLPEKINKPVLFIHHKDDGCEDTPYSDAYKHYEKLKAINSARVSFATVTTHIEPAGNPCMSGVHMFDNDYEEVAKIIDGFVNAP